MRLIDADEFKKQIAGMAIINNYPADKTNKMCELIDNQPTAYDVEMVMECLKGKSIPEDGVLYASVNEFGMYVILKDALEIAKSGGVK